MLISALSEYYDLLSSTGKVLPQGYSKQEVHYLILLTSDGLVADIVDIREEIITVNKRGKQKTSYKPREIILPERTQKPGIDKNIIEHRPLYIFGLNLTPNGFTPEDKTDKAKKSHKIFVESNLEFAEGMTSEIVIAYRNFLRKWKPEEEINNPHLINLSKSYANSYYCFGLDGHPNILLHENMEIKQKWGNILKSIADTESDEQKSLCAISGEKSNIAKIHNKIKGVKNCNSAGGVLVGFKGTAVESYCKEQSFNSSISVKVMKKYTEALNFLLSGNTHKIYIDDMTIVFWAMSSDDNSEAELFSSMLTGDKIDNVETERFLYEMMKNAIQGKNADLTLFNINENVEFYIVGLTPNNSRISVKFLYKDKFGKIINNILMHQGDMCIESTETQIPIWKITKELVSPRSTKETVPPPLLSSVFDSIINGTKYPEALLNTVIRRVKTDSDDIENKKYFIKMNDIRIGVIKACINRKQRLLNKKEEIGMSLNENNNNPAYLCGRLFAVLEKAQQEVSLKLNRTIKDSYFSMAASKPAVVFPRLIKSAQYYISKSDYAQSYNKMIGEIVDKLSDEFPVQLTIEDQGKFIIGYYQQNQSLYKKRKNSERNEDNGTN